MNKIPISVTIDDLTGAIYIRFTDKKVRRTVEPLEEVFVDLDYKGATIGIEVLP